MAAILQLRRGALTDFSDYGTNLSEPYFDTSRDTLHIGTTNGTGSSADWTTLVKLSQANRDYTKNEPNTGSLWLTSGSDGTSGNYTGSNMILYNNIIISGSGFIEGDLHLEGHLFLGSGSDDDVVRVQSEFSGSLIPDNDVTGSLTADADTSYYTLGNDAKRWKNLFLQSNSASGSGATAGFVSASHIDLTGNIKVDELGRFRNVKVDTLTDNRIVLSGPSGQLEDDGNLTYDGQDFRLTNSDYYQSGSGASWQFVGAGGEVTGSWTISELAIDNGIVFTNAEGTVDNSSDFTWDGDFVNIIGGVTASQDLTVNRAAYLASAKVEDLTEDRIVIAGNRGEIEDDQYFRYTGNEFIIGSDEHFKVTVSNGNTSISGSVQLHSTLNVDGQSTLASVNVEDLTDNRVVIVGAGGEIEDDGNFTFNGTELNIGTGNFTVQQGSGNTQIIGTLDVDSQSTLSSLNVEDLTDNRIVIVGTSGEIEDDANLTFNGTELNIGTGNFTVQQGSGNTQIVGTLDVDSQSTLSSVNVEDLTSGRVVLAGTSGEIEDSGNLTFDGSLLTVTGDTVITGDLTVQGDTTQLNVSTLNVEDKNLLIASGAVDASAANGGGITIDGADATLLYGSSDDSFTFNKLLKVNGNISGSSFNGTTLLSSSNENFADYSQSVDSRLDTIEGPMSTSLDSRLLEIFSTGSDHETRIDEIETTFSSSVDSRISSNDSDIISLGSTNNTQNTNIGNLQLTGSDHETRIDAQESFSSSIETHLPSGTVSGSDQVTSSLDSRYVQSGSITGSNVVGSDSLTSIETMTSASYAAITPISGTLYIIVD